MNKEELQAMSNEELNELAAVKVMGYYAFKREGWNALIKRKEEHRNGIYWNPVADMNDAMELLNNFKFYEMHRRIEFYQVTVGFTNGLMGTSYTDKVLPRAITIASILAKESH